MAKERPFYFGTYETREEMDSGPGIVEGCGGDGLGELLEADAPVAVGVGLLDHAGKLGGGEGVAELGHGVDELCGGDVPVAVAVEHLEQPEELLLGVGGLGRHELRGDEDHELGELDEAVSVGVGPLDEGIQLVGARLEAQGAEEGAQLELGEAAVVVSVEGAEDLPELCQLLVVQPHRILAGAAVTAAAHLSLLFFSSRSSRSIMIDDRVNPKQIGSMCRQDRIFGEDLLPRSDL
ncbi:unnamed protein product [Musa acuminata subsp. malaccensis]|uniref:(wild Malaysian banana) hypothetical protein n=1 Tax=Musa acuminata subsp. malaccensis TaxID=214687 RepID=A0A8D7B5X1_MUSAM|nr:unnamed protein product [Musa acuminata subsp. malaccensis]